LEFNTIKKKLKSRESSKLLKVTETILTLAEVRTHHHLLSMVIAQQECLQANSQKLIMFSEPVANCNQKRKYETGSIMIKGMHSANAKGSSQ